MFSFTVKPDEGEEYELTATSRDIYFWEKTHKDASFDNFREATNMVELYEVAHVAARRQGKTDLSLDEFVNTCDLAFEEEEEPDPTRDVPSDTPS